MNTQSIKTATVTTIKTIVAPVHITLQASADLLALGEAKLINKIDGTPMMETMMARTAYTQDKIGKAVAKAMEIQERRDAKKEEARQKHVESLRAKLDQAEGVTQSPEPIVPPVPATPKKESALTKKINEVAQVVIPAPPAPENVFKTPMQAFGNEYVPAV